MNIRYVLPPMLALLCSPVAVLCSPVAVLAGGLPEGYVGVGVGATASSADTASLVVNPARCSAAGAACNVDQASAAWKVYAAYPLSKKMAVEAEYADLGKVLKGSVTQDGVSDSYSQKTAGVGLSLVGKVKPMRNKPLSVYAKAGAFHWISKADANFSPDVVGFGSVTSRKASGTDPVLGVGVEYPVAYRWSVRAGWDRYFNVGERNVMLDEGTSSWQTLDMDMDVYSIGLDYHF